MMVRWGPRLVNSDRDMCRAQSEPTNRFSIIVADEGSEPKMSMSGWKTVLLLGLTVTALTGCGTPSLESGQNNLTELLDRTLPTVDQMKQQIADGQYDSAQDGLQRLRARHPEDLQVAFLLGEVLLHRGQPGSALEQYKAAVASPELQAASLQGAGLSLLQLGRMDEAAASLGQAIALDTSQWRAHNALGRIYDARKDWAAAESAYRNALAANSTSAALHNNLGMSFVMQQRFDEALGEFQQALELDHGLKVAAMNMRVAYALQGKYVEALAGVPESEMPDALNNVGYAALVRGDYKAAEAYLSRALEISPSYHRNAAANLDQLRGLLTLANKETQ